MFGLMGKILRVNLTEGKILKEEIPEEMAKKFLGGRGLASKYLFDENRPGIDPLGPKNVSETTELLKERLDQKFNVASIGIAGENLVKYAAIMNDLHRAAGRCGVGAVMGSKKLKAIAVRGSKKIQIADQKAFTQVTKKQLELLDESILAAGLKAYGTNLVLDMVNVCGGLPTRNWQTGTCSFAEDVNGEALSTRVKARSMRRSVFSAPCAMSRILGPLPWLGISVMIMVWIRFHAAAPLRSPWNVLKKAF
jgi:aldehyde:ferredoxin oxidoreductase